MDLEILRRHDERVGPGAKAAKGGHPRFVGLPLSIPDSDAGGRYRRRRGVQDLKIETLSGLSPVFRLADLLSERRERHDPQQNGSQPTAEKAISCYSGCTGIVALRCPQDQGILIEGFRGVRRVTNVLT